jgi:hypothetical protein
MLSSPIQDETLVDNYRKTPTAEWRNGKGQKKHITELYAIHPDATQERNIFRGDEFVMQTSAFPYDSSVCLFLLRRRRNAGVSSSSSDSLT